MVIPLDLTGTASALLNLGNVLRPFTGAVLCGAMAASQTYEWQHPRTLGTAVPTYRKLWQMFTYFHSA